MPNSAVYSAFRRNFGEFGFVLHVIDRSFIHAGSVEKTSSKDTVPSLFICLSTQSSEDAGFAVVPFERIRLVLRSALPSDFRIVFVRRRKSDAFLDACSY